MRSACRRLATLLLAVLLGACGSGETHAPARASSPLPDAIPTARPAADPPAAASELRIVFLGDSLTAGDGLPVDQAYPAVIERELRERGAAIRVVNAGLSGDTSTGGLARLDWLLKQRPDVIVVALGANDGLRGHLPEVTESNLRAIVTRSREAGAAVLLCGMRVPESMGAGFATSFREVYPRIATDLDVPLVPFLLDGVALEPDLNLPDGIHPNPEGQRRLAATVLRHLEPLLPALPETP